jgi:putative transposase
VPSTHLSLHYHVVFSTKNRQPWIDDAWREDLHHYLGGCAKTLDAVPEQIGGVIKKVSSRWVHEHASIPMFAWQDGYGAFTVSRSNIAPVRNYIATQAEHHRKRTFQDEYRELLMKHEIAFDERHLW